MEQKKKFLPLEIRGNADDTNSSVKYLALTNYHFNRDYLGKDGLCVYSVCCSEDYTFDLYRHNKGVRGIDADFVIMGDD